LDAHGIDPYFGAGGEGFKGASSFESVPGIVVIVDHHNAFHAPFEIAMAAGIGERFGLHKTLSAVKNIRGIGKRHMVHNDYAPRMEIDPQTYVVRADVLLLTCEPASVLPMAQRYFLF
jgi:urease alpha subunit